MAAGVQLVHLDGSDIPEAAWQTSLNSIAQGHRVSLITADGQTFDLNASDIDLSGVVGGAGSLSGVATMGGIGNVSAVGNVGGVVNVGGVSGVVSAQAVTTVPSSRQAELVQQQTLRQPTVPSRGSRPQMITIIQEDGTQQTLNVVQVIARFSSVIVIYRFTANQPRAFNLAIYSLQDALPGISASNEGLVAIPIDVNAITTNTSSNGKV